MVTKRTTRARQPAHKQERREALLAAASALFEKGDYEQVTMAQVAQRARVSKGSVFLYYPTKESLFLQLLGREVGPFFAFIEAGLQGGGRWSVDRVMQTFAAAIQRGQLFMRLMCLLHLVLEQNLTVEVAEPFKRLLLQQLSHTGGLLESRLPFLKAGDGLKVLLTINALLVGFKQMSEPGPAVRAVLALPEMKPLAIDFETELFDAVHHLLLGYERRHRTGASP